MLTDVDGIEVGHWTDAVGRTGCTVVVMPEGSVASGEVRGGAPATREFALLDPSNLVSEVNAVVLSGGSAFGLAACDGVVDGLAQKGAGHETKFGPVPIVVGMSLFDLGAGDPSARPGHSEGLAALTVAQTPPSTSGCGRTYPNDGTLSLDAPATGIEGLNHLLDLLEPLG